MLHEPKVAWILGPWAEQPWRSQIAEFISFKILFIFKERGERKEKERDRDVDV